MAAIQTIHVRTSPDHSAISNDSSEGGMLLLLIPLISLSFSITVRSEQEERRIKKNRMN